ncbi:MAG: hypothetical protein MAG551_00780 [Candidatus Scalindua arabica]|uniref:Uncharacterized protein n=1 Tax=Candidatus Scalindua arabica TaxID=1127984 RepID=A0A941W131_9BACT|nr:hypothetical protein [Candidatus Scalindua arabica]
MIIAVYSIDKKKRVGSVMPPTLSKHNNSLFPYLHASSILETKICLEYNEAFTFTFTFTYPYPWDDQPLDDQTLDDLS